MRETDEALIRLGDSSLPVRAMSRAGQLLVAAGRDSLCAAAISEWLAMPLDRRVRLVAIVMGVAVLSHVTVTGFRAPEPIPAARAAWVAVLLILTAVGACARGISAAWIDWKARRTAHERETA